MRIDWKDSRWQGKVGAMLFEQLSFNLLTEMGFHNLKWTGRSPGDQGRDIEGTLEVPDPFEGKITQKWFVECKFSASGVSLATLEKSIRWCDAHKPHVFLVITNSTVTNEARRWVETAGKDKVYGMRFLEGLRLEQLIMQHKAVFHKYWEAPKDYFSATVLHLLDADPNARKTGLDLFAHSDDKDKVLGTLADILRADGHARTRAAESLSDIIEDGLSSVNDVARHLSRQLKKAGELEDGIFSAQPEAAAQYDQAIDRLCSTLARFAPQQQPESDSAREG